MMRTEVINPDSGLDVIPDDASGIVELEPAAPEAISDQELTTDAEIFAAEFSDPAALKWRSSTLGLDLDAGTIAANRLSEGYSQKMAAFIQAQAGMGKKMPWMVGSPIVAYANDRRLRKLGITQ